MNDGGTIELRVGGGINGTLLATTPVSNTGSLNNWDYVESNISVPTGKNDLYFVFKNASNPNNSFDVNFIEFLGAGISVDRTPPLVDDIEVLSPTQVRVEFSEYVQQASSELVSNYAISGGGVNISSVDLLENDRSVLLTTSSMNSGTSYQLTISNVQNEAGISIVSDTHAISTLNAIRINVGGGSNYIE